MKTKQINFKRKRVPRKLVNLTSLTPIKSLYKDLLQKFDQDLRFLRPGRAGSLALPAGTVDQERALLDLLDAEQSLLSPVDLGSLGVTRRHSSHHCPTRSSNNTQTTNAPSVETATQSRSRERSPETQAVLQPLVSTIFVLLKIRRYTVVRCC